MESKASKHHTNRKNSGEKHFRLYVRYIHLYVSYLHRSSKLCLTMDIDELQI